LVATSYREVQFMYLFRTIGNGVGSRKLRKKFGKGAGKNPEKRWVYWWSWNF